MSPPQPGYGIPLASAERLLREHEPVATIEAEWTVGPVRLSAYLGEVVLPAELPHRVRCLLTDGQVALVAWDDEGRPEVFPGGGAEPGETVVGTACREVWEETGWHVDAASIEVLGWIHLYSAGVPTPRLRFPHPDSFMTVVRAAPLAGQEHPKDWRDLEGYVARSEFLSVANLPALILTNPVSCAFLDVAFGAGMEFTCHRLDSRNRSAKSVALARFRVVH